MSLRWGDAGAEGGAAESLERISSTVNLGRPGAATFYQREEKVVRPAHVGEEGVEYMDDSNTKKDENHDTTALSRDFNQRSNK